MPRIQKHISDFHSGLISNPDTFDIPDDAYTSGNNIDPEGEGKIKGIEASTASTANAVNMEQGYWITDTDGTWNLIGANTSTNNIQVVEDFYGTPSSTTFSPAVKPNSFVIRGLGAHIALNTANAPRWCGLIKSGQFSGSAPTGFQHTQAECSNYAGSSNGDFGIGLSRTGSGGSFINGYLYDWGYSLIYENLQESPIYKKGEHSVYTTWEEDDQYEQIVITAYGATTSPTSFNPRITGINIYRAESTTGNAQDLGYYKLITTIDINSGSWSTSGDDKTYTYNDTGGTAGASYIANSGVSEAYDSTMVYYTYSTESSGYLFGASAYVSGLPDATLMVFRSQQYRYDTFPWAEDYIKLPRVPTAITSFKGRVFAFDESTMYMIEPERFYLSDTFSGAGCSSHRSWVKTPYGLFFANSQNCYLWDGSTIKPIAGRILSDWQGESSTPILNYDEKKNIVLCHFGNECYYYHIPKQRWDYSSTFQSNTVGCFSGKDGESYTTTTTGSVENFGSSSTRSWSYTSKEFDFGDRTEKKFYNLLYDGSGTTSVQFGLNKATADTSLTNSTEIKSGGNWARGESLVVNFTGLANASVTGYTMVLRKLGLRDET